MKLEYCEVDIQGTTPLIINNPRAASPLDVYSRRMKEISSKRKKTIEDHEKLLLLQWESRLYWLDSLGVYIPWENIFACLLKAAKKHKLGPKMAAVTFQESIGFALEAPNSKNLQALTADDDNKFQKLVTIQRSKTLCCRPIFRQWGCSFELEFDSELIDKSDLKTILVTAAREVGLGDWRPSSPTPGPYGRFTIKKINFKEGTDA